MSRLALFICMSIFFTLGAKANCKDDAQKYCKGLKPGKELFECMKANKENLSNECKEKIADKKQKIVQGIKECRNDIKEYCHDIKKGEGRIVKCLKANEAKLSVECKKYFARKVK